MSPRARVISFGSAGLLVVAGAACAALVSGGTGQILSLVLIGLGLVLVTALVFLEVGLSEDRQRAREQPDPVRRAGRRAPAGRAEVDGRPARLERPRLGRSRDHPRRLR